jgi:hypothetical protein
MNTDEEIIMTQTMGPGIKWSDSSQTQMLNGEYLPLDFDGLRWTLSFKSQLCK